VNNHLHPQVIQVRGSSKDGHEPIQRPKTDDWSRITLLRLRDGHNEADSQVSNPASEVFQQILVPLAPIRVRVGVKVDCQHWWLRRTVLGALQDASVQRVYHLQAVCLGSLCVSRWRI
jgi:hypothetical protein